MASQSQVEWKTEAALIEVLGDSLDLAGIEIRRAKQAASLEYPCIVVECISAEDEPWSPRLDFSRCQVEVTCCTYTRDDSTGSVVAGLVGAVRDSARDPAFVADLSGAVLGYQVHGALLDGPTSVGDDERIRRRTIALTIHCSAFNIAENSSSSSSSGP